MGYFLSAVCFCFLLVAVLVGASMDRGECLASHEYTWLMPIHTGDVTIYVPTESTTCDRWQFPEGRP